MAFDYPSNFSSGLVVNNTGSLVQYMNYVSEGWFAYGFLLVIFIMTLSVGAFTGFRKILAASSFITFVFAVYFMRLGVINPLVIFALIVLMIVGILGSKESGSY